jgi:alpha/beta superfamily hydrolase
LFSVPDKSNGNLVINCSGLPGQPENYELFSYLTQKGFVCVHPKYEGTWESEGKFLDHSPVDDLRTVINYIIESHVLESAYDGSLIKLEFNNIFLMGSSFGGSVALVTAANSNDVMGVVSIAPVTDFTKQGKGDSNEQDLAYLGKFLKKGFGRAYNLDLDDWSKLLNGNIDLNPVDHVESLLRKNVLLIHGEADKTISIYKTKDFFKRIENDKSKLICIPDTGHLSFYHLRSAGYLDRISEWITSILE